MNTARTQPVAHDGQAGTGHEDHPVDLAHLARQAMGDKGLECEVMRLYAHQAEVCVEQLKSADTARAWLEAAHALKGSASGIGAWRVADVASAAEKQNFDDHTGDIDSIVARVAQSVREANDFIDQTLRDVERSPAAPGDDKPSIS